MARTLKASHHSLRLVPLAHGRHRKRTGRRGGPVEKAKSSALHQASRTSRDTATIAEMGSSTAVTTLWLSAAE
ncbi:hypothetical protein AX14_001160 [Amanita brunnescens Koide BX004]|nr:hypothetical protein AX14_001160 [Amanita brunnescens Koide BX004]